MSVSNYTPNNKYKYNKLEKVVYLIDENALKDITIDNGAAYVSGITQEPLALQTNSINLQDSEELDERYKFTHTLTFSINGYANYKYFGGRYYVIVKSKDGVYWLVNPLFPCKVSYTYILDGNASHTDFTMATISNYPTLRVEGFSEPTTNDCIGYMNCHFESLKLNERDFSRKTESIVRYTNDGFKDVIYLKNSAVFKENFDGNNISHSLEFNINFDDYKSSWHYNLLEFIENKYSAIIKTSCGKYILTGFGFGLNPSFNVTAANDNVNNISISMSDLHDNGDFIWYDDELTITKSSGKTFVYTSDYNGYECVDDNTAKYLLKEEVDDFENPLGNFLVLNGYANNFPDLNIVGTFYQTEEFYCTECHNLCTMQTSFPAKFVFNTVGCRTYSLICSTDWSISSDLTVQPSAGDANTPYEISICNYSTPSSTPSTSTLTVQYCGRSKSYDVVIVESDSCFTAGETFDITANDQYVTIPTQCCISAVTESSGTITNIQVFNNYLKVYVPQNNSGSGRTFTLDVTFCDDTTGQVTINQSNGFETWVSEYYSCDNGLKCEVERRYTGLTAADCNDWTPMVRYVNCVASDECSGTMLRWVDSIETTCSEGRKYVIQVEQESTNSGTTWTNTGNKRLGDETQDSPAECEGASTEEKWEVDTGYFCNDATKYSLERLYTREVGTEEWIPTTVIRKGDTVIESGSTDCGAITGSNDWHCSKWELADGYVCEETTKYAREQRYVSNYSGTCSAATDWTPTGIYRSATTVLESASTECGYVKATSSYTYNEWRTVGGYVCEGTTKYNRERLFQRDSESSPWVGSEIYRRGSRVLEPYSTDCGYVIGSDDWTCEKWELDDVADYYICEDTTKYKTEQRFVRNCIDCQNCEDDWIATGIHRLTSIVAETDSIDCGYYTPSSAWTCDKWEIADGYICEETTKYAREQRYVRNCSGACSSCTSDWIATNVYRRSDIILDENSEDCGYNPYVSGNCETWIDDGDTICDGFDEYKYLHKYVRNCSNCNSCSETWIPTDIYKKGTLIQSNSFNCGYQPIPTYARWIEDGDMQCYGYDNYLYLKKEVSQDNVNWYSTSIRKKGRLYETNSIDCGYIPTENTGYTRWNNSGYMCNGGNQYVRLRKLISDDGVNFYTTSIFKQGDLVMTNSPDCGYIPNGTYTKWEFDDYTCDGFAKYIRQRKYISDDNVNWYETNIYRPYSLIENNSLDCGYIPTENFNIWTTAGSICNGFNKYQNLVKQISDDGDRWYITNITKIGSLIKENSEDCGYNAEIKYEYRWIITDSTECDGTDLVLLYKQQRRRLYYTGAQWEDVVPTVYSIDGEGTKQVVTAESESYECGYEPPINAIFKWENMGISSNYICDDCSVMYKLSAEYLDGTVHTVQCSGSTLTTADTKPQSHHYSGMTAALIEDCVTSIGSDAFNGCINLMSITINSSTPPTLGSNVLENTNNCAIYVPSGSVNTYKSASGWSIYSSRIQAIS